MGNTMMINIMSHKNSKIAPGGISPKNKGLVILIT